MFIIQWNLIQNYTNISVSLTLRLENTVKSQGSLYIDLDFVSNYLITVRKEPPICGCLQVIYIDLSFLGFQKKAGNLQNATNMIIAICCRFALEI